MKHILSEIKVLEAKISAETGPRGGKIIGKTKSGKPIYDSADHPSHKDFSIQDHRDAANKHKGLVDPESTDIKSSQHHPR